jgi:hypothetical protein
VGYVNLVFGIVVLSPEKFVARCTSVIKTLVQLSGARFQKMRVMIPKGLATAYSMRIAYFVVIFRQGCPYALHFLRTSSVSCSIASSCLKATISAINRLSIPKRAIVRKLWATDHVAGSNLLLVWSRP